MEIGFNARFPSTAIGSTENVSAFYHLSGVIIRMQVSLFIPILCIPFINYHIALLWLLYIKIDPHCVNIR